MLTHSPVHTRTSWQCHGAALCALISLGMGGLFSATGCQSSGKTSAPIFRSTSNSLAAPQPLSNEPPVRAVAYQVPRSEASEESEQPDSLALSEPTKLPAPVTIADQVTFQEPVDELKATSSDGSMIAEGQLSNEYPIDLTTALRLAGANHLQIALATERIREANAKLDQAKVLWVPSINAGVGYNRHDGPIQDTSGNVIDVSRQSLYAGGGPTVGSSPLSGGASGPARLFVDLSTADILFEPLAARQNVQATRHARRVAENDNVLQVGLVYQELVRAHFQIGIADEAIQNAQQLLELTQKFEAAGKGLAADTQRARGELQQRLHQRAGAQEQVAVNSAELVRLLQLDSSTRLVTLDSQPLPLELVSLETPIETLIGQGMTRRPELAEHRARVAETLTRIEQEKWRPWLPHLFAGYAGAGFGGGRNGDMENFGYRGDFDAMAVWQVRNLGLGNRALQREKGSQNRQACLQFEWIRDQVIADVAKAYSRARYRKEQMEYAQQQVAAAADALPLNLTGIRDGVIRPIEAQQAIAGLAAARSLYLAAVIDFNQAQLELVRALGDSVE